MRRRKYTILITSFLTFVMLFSSSFAKAANDVLSVASVNDGGKIGYAVYWPKDKGEIILERSENSGPYIEIAKTVLHFYTDYDIKSNSTYTYRVNIGGKALTTSSSIDSSGQPTISNIKIEAGATSKTEASVVLTFQTDRLSRSQIYYGTSVSYENKTELNSALNQSHTILIEGLKPDTAYHLKVIATDKSGVVKKESEDQTFTTPKSPDEQTIIDIIIQALIKAFSGFEQWFKS